MENKLSSQKSHCKCLVFLWLIFSYFTQPMVNEIGTIFSQYPIRRSQWYMSYNTPQLKPWKQKHVEYVMVLILKGFVPDKDIRNEHLEICSTRPNERDRFEWIRTSSRAGLWSKQVPSFNSMSSMYVTLFLKGLQLLVVYDDSINQKHDPHICGCSFIWTKIKTFTCAVFKPIATTLYK